MLELPPHREDDREVVVCVETSSPVVEKSCLQARGVPSSPSACKQHRHDWLWVKRNRFHRTPFLIDMKRECMRAASIDIDNATYHDMQLGVVGTGFTSANDGLGTIAHSRGDGLI